MNKGFTTPCFIRKNTPELRKKLEELGYSLETEWSGTRTIKTYANGTCLQDMFFPECKWDVKDLFAPPNAIDCGTNEALFLALAALNDSDDYMQFFVHNDNPYRWSLCQQKSAHLELPVTKDWHKATIVELMEHFKNRK